MDDLPTLDTHAHVDLPVHPDDGALTRCGAVLAQTMNLDEAERSVVRSEPHVAWGVGCHPRSAAAQAAFTPPRFRALLERTAVIGEVGLDGGSAVPMETQLATLRAVLLEASERPRLVSIHSFRATRPVLDELRRTPVVAPMLHWWTGHADETSEAVELGCYFSIHAAVARRSLWRTRVPPERILLESDHGWGDPPEAIPLRIGWVEHLVGQQYGVSPEEIRLAGWRNFARLVAATGVDPLLPAGIRETLAQVPPIASELS
jgi:TatD DNase family protein